MLFWKNNLYYHFWSIFSKTLRQILSEDSSERFTEDMIATYLFISGGLWQLMDEWLKEGARRLPEEMGDYADTIYDMMC